MRLCRHDDRPRFAPASFAFFADREVLPDADTLAATSTIAITS